MLDRPQDNTELFEAEKLPFGYLTATSYSGSTLLSLLMNSHPEVVSIGELANAIAQDDGRKTYACSCGDEISQCEFWAQVRDLCQLQGIDLNLYDFELTLDLGWGALMNRIAFGQPLRMARTRRILDHSFRHLPSFNHAVRKVMDRSITIAQSVTVAAGKSVFFDASKEIRRAKLLATDARLRFRLVHLVRDPRAVLFSFIRRNGTSRVDEIIGYWLRTHTNALRLKAKLAADQYLLVSYENLCENPESTLGELCLYLGVDARELVSRVDSQPHHIIGNQMRNQGFRGIKKDEQWRSQLTSDIWDHCDTRTLELASKFGYQRRS